MDENMVCTGCNDSSGNDHFLCVAYVYVFSGRCTDELLLWMCLGNDKKNIEIKNRPFSILKAGFYVVKNYQNSVTRNRQ